ncbi:putative nucleoside-diphosphate sugar epimerase [Burkholderiales bacterium JOSHI_001]|nr:putative nucleoside-diphosphate sugar epimerase [Burkholderiales bacterium JOSHI_001]
MMHHRRTALAGLSHRLAHLPARRKLLLMLLCDGVMLPLCAFVSLVLGPPNLKDGLALGAWPYVLVGLTTMLVLALSGLYRTVVRYIDHRSVVRAALMVLPLLAAAYLLAETVRLPHLPSAVVIYCFVGFSYLLVSRHLARSALQIGMKHAGKPRRPTMIYGAGRAGVQLAQAMRFSVDYQPGCFMDDDPHMQGRVVAGLKVYGPDHLELAIARHQIEQIVVAIPSAPVSTRRTLIARLEAAGLPVKLLPGLVEMVAGQATVSDIRDIDVSDLLGRDPVPPEPSLFARNIQGKCVLVTGAGGSIGSELCRQILSQHPSVLVLLDHSEFALYSIEQELSHMCGGTRLVSVLGSVTDSDLLVRTMQKHGVQTAYHAAAYKHVPMVEANVRQGVLNNVFGTLSLAKAARQCQLETCVLISTDKAVRPTNAMGASKRIAELVFQAVAARHDGPTVFSMVRFGNVLGSSGSVVPLFKRQIQQGGPVTITHPDIIRYFMLIPEAAQLVIQAGAMARGGEVFVLDMGEPVRIADLARTMIRLSGLRERNAEEPDGDIEIKFVGLRPGEKLYEELLIGDQPVPSGHPRIMCAKERFIEPVLLDKMLGALGKACEQGDVDAVVRQVRNLVPEYRDADEVNAAARIDRTPTFMATTP